MQKNKAQWPIAFHIYIISHGNRICCYPFLWHREYTQKDTAKTVRFFFACLYHTGAFPKASTLEFFKPTDGDPRVAGPSSTLSTRKRCSLMVTRAPVAPSPGLDSAWERISQDLTVFVLSVVGDVPVVSEVPVVTSSILRICRHSFRRCS
jgi:hypothetical protein